MKYLVFICLFFLILCPNYYSQINLKGFLETDNGSTISNVRIAVSGTEGTWTDSLGYFQITVPNDFVEGEQVIIKVYKKNWEINQPLDGIWNLPSKKYQNIYETKIILVPHGSKKLWSNERIEKYISQLADENAKLKLELGQSKIDLQINKPKAIDFLSNFDEWAKKYGYTIDEVKKYFDNWAESDYIKNSSNYRIIALRNFYLKNLKEAAVNFEKAARIEQLRMETSKLSAYQNWLDAGNSYFIDDKYEEALIRFYKADSLVTQKNYPKQWARIQSAIGRCFTGICQNLPYNKVDSIFAITLKYFDNALKVYDKKRYKKEWTKTQGDFGNLYSVIGEAKEKKMQREYYNQAIKFF